jgi:alkylation response protein AidB-like acyl-CoA dehydrogenase
MNFDLTDEQQMLSDTARDVLSRTYDTESRNKVVDSELGWSREVWQQLAEIGILGLGLEPEESGPIEVMVVMTEVGRRLAPEPVAAAALIPGAVIAAHGSAQQRELLDDVASGERLLAFGDGYVEIENTKQAGGLAVAVASDEAHNGSGRVDEWKRQRLLGVGADVVIPDFRDATPLLECIFGKGEGTRT